MLRRLCLLGLLILAAGAAVAGAVATSPAGEGAPLADQAGAAKAFGLDQDAALRRSQAVLGTTLADFRLQDRAGETIALSRYRGRPLLVNFIYTGCFHVCPNSTRALHQAVSAMRERFGDKQFNVITVGFNPPSDSPTAMRDYARRQGIDDPNWEFLSLRPDQVAGLSDAFGFSFVPTPMGFDHILQVSVVDADGRIQHQVYGDTFNATALGEPLKRLLTGSLFSAPLPAGGGLADLLQRVRILCSVYDPITGRYRVDYSLYLEIAGFLTFVAALLVVLIGEWRARRAARRALVAP